MFFLFVGQKVEYDSFIENYSYIRESGKTILGGHITAQASRTVGGRFWYRIFLPYRKSLFFTPNASECASRTPGSLF